MTVSNEHKVERLKEELAKYGIYTEEELDEALKKVEINIGCMAATIDNDEIKGAI